MKHHHQKNWKEVHALAVQSHSSAFDAEANRNSNAKALWLKALDYWQILIGEREFWRSMREKGKKLEPSLFQDDSLIQRLKASFYRNLVQVHVNYILDSLNDDPKRAAYHFEIIRTVQSGSMGKEYPLIVNEARRQIYQNHLLPYLLEQNDEKSFAAAVRSAKAVHFFDPTSDTTTFLLKAYLDWIRMYENNQIKILSERYPESFRTVTAKFKNEENEDYEQAYCDQDLFDDAIDEINQDDDIAEQKELQNIIVEDLEPVIPEAERFCDVQKVSIRQMIGEAKYFMGRYYCSPDNEERDLDEAIMYLEDATAYDSMNTAARHLLQQLYELEY